MSDRLTIALADTVRILREVADAPARLTGERS
jgi:hypothetical protein